MATKDKRELEKTKTPGVYRRGNSYVVYRPSTNTAVDTQPLAAVGSRRHPLAERCQPSPLSDGRSRMRRR